jgi:NADH-quinone oxidoreductase subunit L
MRNMGGLARRSCRDGGDLMWIATLAIAGIPPFSGFFSKDEILAGLCRSARDSTLAEASWLGIPGSVVLYGRLRLLPRRRALTAIYMTRMMLYTFHGENRTGEGERGAAPRGAVGHDGPLVVLGVLSPVGGWLNLPAHH